MDLNAEQAINYNNYFAYNQQSPNMPLMVMGPCMPPPSDLSTVAYVGTLSYMSPERLEGQGYSFPSDIWALGMIIYELVVGRSPYPLTDKAIILSENMRKMDAPSFDGFPGVSVALKDFIKKCLRKNPEEREAAVNLLNHPFILAYSNNLHFESQHVGWLQQYKVMRDFFEHQTESMHDHSAFL